MLYVHILHENIICLFACKKVQPEETDMIVWKFCYYQYQWLFKRLDEPNGLWIKCQSLRCFAYYPKKNKYGDTHDSE